MQFAVPGYSEDCVDPSLMAYDARRTPIVAHFNPSDRKIGHLVGVNHERLADNRIFTYFDRNRYEKSQPVEPLVYGDN